MKFKKTYLIFALSLSIIFLYFSNKNNYENLFKTVNEKRIENNIQNTNKIDLSKYTFDENDKYNLGISEEQLKYLNPNYYVTSSGEVKYNESNITTEVIELTKEDAISDVDFLFNALKYSYAGYIYFGGDEIWNNAKNSIINSINSHDNLTSKDLEKIIFNNLNFVQDGHFSINFNSPLQKSNFYYSEEFEIKEDKNGYYIDHQNNKFYIKSINNDLDIKNYIKPSLNKNGDLCNYIGVLSKINSFRKIKVVLESNNQEQIIYVKLTKSKSESYPNQQTSYNYEKINGIPIFTMRKMYNVDSNDNSVELFGESANKAKNEKIIIMDIRGNIGGNGTASLTWFKNFTGKNPIQYYDFTYIKSASLINNYLTKLIYREPIEITDFSTKIAREDQEKLLEMASSNENKWYIETLKNKENNLIKNDVKIFVLIDNNVASAAEIFLYYLNNIENVLLIGTNTSGVCISENNINCVLPNSKISINYGNNLILYNNFVEGVGFQPDIWIGGSDSLDRLLKFIK